jgi:hypothetical protein
MTALDVVRELLAEHAGLRASARRLEELLCPQTGVGLDDIASCDVVALLDARESLVRDILAHEKKEEAYVDARGTRVPELGEWMESSHEDLNSLLSLLASVSSTYDGRRAHALRAIVGRVREELEAHLRYEEKVVFPLLREPK